MNFSKKNREHNTINKYVMSKKLSIIVIFLLSLFGNIQSTEAQFLKKLKKRAEEAAKETISRKVEDKTAQKTEKVMDTILNADKKIIRKKKSKKEKKVKSNNNSNEENYNENVSEEFNVYSKFDFVPGDKILLFDDFSLDNIGDFPSKWNTNGTGELVTIDGDKWFMLAGKSTYIPDVTALPENYTVEFDMVIDGVDKKTSSQAKLEIWLQDHNSFGRTKNMAKVEIPLAQYTSAGFVVENRVNSERVIRNVIEKDVRELILDYSHVSIAVNGKRFRLWLNENKIVDVPRLVPENIAAFKLYPRSLRDGQDQIFVSNLKIAESGEDLRSQLLANGNYSTTGILFNSGSDQIKPESYGVIKRIAMALEQEPTMGLNIIGHTDADGDEENNLALSEQRAQSVKNILVSQFRINEDRLQIQGKGESEPTADNNTAEGKANNRRVEFVKI